MQNQNMGRLEDFWEKMHDDETKKWEFMMSRKP